MANIIWKDFYKGQTSSPYTKDGAFSKAVNIDIFGQYGIARIDYKPAAQTFSSGPASLISKITKEYASGAKLWAADGTSLFQSTDEGENWAPLAGGSGGNNPIYWKNAIICPHENDIDVYKLSGGAWETDFGGANVMNTSTSEHFTFHSVNDDKIYICD